MKVQFIDLEMLCWDNANIPQGQTNHIIQIGIVEVETETLKIVRSKSYFIRPQNKNFEVSQYCTDLTGITRSQLIDEGRYFSEVINSIRKDFAPQNKLVFAWGSDYNPLAQHCADYNVPNPWSELGIEDFGLFFRAAYDQKHKLPLNKALASLGISFEGIQHDAEWDARALAQLYIETIRRIRSVKNVDTGLAF